MKKQILFLTVVIINCLLQNILHSQEERLPDMKLNGEVIATAGDDVVTEAGTLYLLSNPLNNFISSVSPIQNAISINKSSDITVVFSQSMDASTMNSSNIKTFGLRTGKLSTLVSYNAGNRTATINPAGNFKVGEKIQVTLSSGIQTSSNTPITPFTWSFTVQTLSGTAVFTEVPVDTGINERSFVSGDFDNDGDLDIITLNADSNNFSVYKNGQQANFTKTSTLQINISSKSIIGGDLDNDGDLDIVIAGDNELTIYKNNGSAVFSEHFGMTLMGGNTLTGFADAGDLDGDGDIDLFWGAISPAIPLHFPIGFIFLNNGDGSFNYPQSISFGVGFMTCSGGVYPADLVEIEIADFDNDGDLDVAASALQERDCIGTVQDIYHPYIRILFNNGNSQFSFVPYISLDSISPLTTGNFDNDEDADIVSNNLLLRNNDTGSFSPSSNDINGSLLISSDFDADGDLDIVAAKNPNKLFLHKNTGNATFTLPTDLNLNNPLALESGDFDGDGDLDIVVLSGSGTDLSILINAANTITCSIFSIIEGFYDVNLNKLNISDTVRAYLRNVNAPYNIVDSSQAVIDSVLLNGIFTFMNAPTGTYYIVTKHRNGLETWSKPGGENITTGGLYNYDFTSSQSQAYGNNLTLNGTKYCSFSGDVDQNGVIALSDMLLVYNDASNFATGYINTDLNGNNATGLSDILIAYNNSTNFVSLKRP